MQNVATFVHSGADGVQQGIGKYPTTYINLSSSHIWTTWLKNAEQMHLKVCLTHNLKEPACFDENLCAGSPNSAG